MENHPRYWFIYGCCIRNISLCFLFNLSHFIDKLTAKNTVYNLERTAEKTGLCSDKGRFVLLDRGNIIDRHRHYDRFLGAILSNFLHFSLFLLMFFRNFLHFLVPFRHTCIWKQIPFFHWIGSPFFEKFSHNNFSLKRKTCLYSQTIVVKND